MVWPRGSDMDILARSGWLICLGLSACAGGPVIAPPPAVDPWDTLADPAVAAVWTAASSAIQAGRDAEALPLLRQVVERAPAFVPAHLRYQDIALGLGGDAATAMRTFYRERHEQEPAIAYAQARLLTTPFEQFEAVRRIQNKHPAFPWAPLSIARLQRARGQSGDAAAAYRQVLALRGDQLDAHLELAETLIELGLDAEAATHYQNYLRGAPQDAVAMRAYVALLVYRLGRPAEAMPWIERLLARDPRDEGALMDRAAATWRRGQPREALAAYLQILEQRPANARAALNIGYLYYDALATDAAGKQTYWPKARAAFRLYLQIVRPQEGMDHLEQQLAVPFRLQEIAREIGAEDPARVVTVQDLR
ncbi:MAG: tetratricopeptide repeat protein [Planctomycetes bacterium]|nr:tetratricopeptide repeat protein [Planctomycetota bacterium]